MTCTKNTGSAIVGYHEVFTWICCVRTTSMRNASQCMEFDDAVPYLQIRFRVVVHTPSLMAASLSPYEKCLRTSSTDTSLGPVVVGRCIRVLGFVRRVESPLAACPVP